MVRKTIGMVRPRRSVEEDRYLLDRAYVRQAFALLTVGEPPDNRAPGRGYLREEAQGGDGLIVGRLSGVFVVEQVEQIAPDLVVAEPVWG